MWEPYREKSLADPGQDILFSSPLLPPRPSFSFSSSIFLGFIFIHRATGVEGRVSKKQGPICVDVCVCVGVCAYSRKGLLVG